VDGVTWVSAVLLNDDIFRLGNPGMFRRRAATGALGFDHSGRILEMRRRCGGYCGGIDMKIEDHSTDV
jgi:hypothetical protein